MKRTLLTGIAVLFLVTGAAHAQGNLAEQLGINDIRTPVAEIGNQLIEPPKEYDHEYYRGKLIVKRTDERGIKLECWTQSLTGCALFRRRAKSRLLGLDRQRRRPQLSAP